MFPDTSFRSAFVQEAPGRSLTLCSKRQKDQARTRYAYLWAVRVPDAGSPKLSLDHVAHVPAGVTTEIPVKLANNKQWTALDRASDWRLVAGDKSVPVRVRPVAERKALRLRLGDAKVPAGIYRLAANWDWDELTTKGEVQVHEVNAAGEATFSPASLDLLIEGSGSVETMIEGCDFEFVESLSVRRKGEDFSIASPVYRLPQGQGKGPQHSLEVTLDTDSLAAGEYVLAVDLRGDVQRESAFRVLPPHPELEGLPLLANLGENEQVLLLRGTGLDRVTAVRSDRGEFTLNGGGEVHVTLGPDVKQGERLNLELDVEGVSHPLPIEGAVEVIGPRPRIKGSRVSLPENLGVELREGELPAGSFASFSLQLEPLDSPPVLDLGCTQPNLALQPQQAAVGQQSSEVRLRSAGAGTLFLSLNPGAIGSAGCILEVKVRADTRGSSDAFRLGNVVRLPGIGKFELSTEEAGFERFFATLEGEELELIERVGWNAENGSLVEELPVPVAAGGHRQTLKIVLPWPSPAPHAPLYIWLRGEERGRLTTARY
jgi:hypothetical protein